MTSIFVSTPVMDKPELYFMTSFYEAATNCHHHVKMCYQLNDSLISRVRNLHLRSFLDSDCDYFCSLDSDLEIMNTSKNDNIFDKLVAHDKNFTGGLYAKKMIESEATTRNSASIPKDPKKILTYDTGLIEMDWLSSGCWMIKRKVIEKMIEAHPELIYDGDANYAGMKIPGLYIPYITDIKVTGNKSVKKYLSEDWAFCQRYKDLGGQIWADTSILLKHIGRTSYKLFDVKEVKQTKQ